MIYVKTIAKSAWFVGKFCLLLCFAGVLLAPPVLANPNTKASTKFERMAAGQYVIDVHINGQGPFRFMIDTAATRTSIFEKTRKTLGLETRDNAEVFINGIVDSGLRPTAVLQNLNFAGETFTQHMVVVLEDWRDTVETIDGILGLDVFAGLVLAFTHHDKQMMIEQGGHTDSAKYQFWKKIKLLPNPYTGEDYGLFFTRAEIGGYYIPTLLDTGASFTTINWKSVKGIELGNYKHRLRTDWVVQGAVGTFKPSMRIRLNRLKVGGVRLRNHELLIMDFDKLPINAYGKHPLVITGVDLMAGRDFVLDFAGRQLLIAPQPHSPL